MTHARGEFSGLLRLPASRNGDGTFLGCRRAVARLAVAVLGGLRLVARALGAAPARAMSPACAGVTDRSERRGGPLATSSQRRPGPSCGGAGPGELAFIALALAILLLTSLPAHAAPTFPQLTGRIVDDAGLLTLADRTAIESDLAALENQSTDQLVVVTLTSLQGYEIEDFGYRLGRHWGIGQAGRDNGVLLIVAPNERKVRIEVGRGLEPLVTDLMSRIIIENAILPEFRRGDFSAGIRAGVRDVKDTLLGDAEAVKERARGLNQGDGPDWLGLLLIAFWIAVFAYIVYAQYRQADQATQTLGRDRRRRGRRLRDGGGVLFPGGASDSWGGGGWSSGGGGGWSGGGGGFGGGGGSGSW